MKCVILDDEPYAHQVLEHYIHQTPGMQLAAGFRNSIEAFEYLGKYGADLLFLDIEMPLINGISFLKALPVKPKTILTTAYKDYAFEGFELGVVDYLLKPFSFERFTMAVNKITIMPTGDGSSADSLFIKDKDGLLAIRYADIMYVEGCKDYIKLVTSTKEHVIYHTLKAMLAKLESTSFLQVHRSYLVNKAHISRILSDSIILHNDHSLPIGQSFKNGFLEGLVGG